MTAADVLADRFPQALGAVLAGSAARGDETATSDLALVSRGHWTGTGRWLVRHLRQVDPDLGRRLLSGLRHAIDGDAGHLLATGRAELDRLGGPLDAGYERHA